MSENELVMGLIPEPFVPPYIKLTEDKISIETFLTKRKMYFGEIKNKYPHLNVFFRQIKLNTINTIGLQSILHRFKGNQLG